MENTLLLITHLLHVECALYVCAHSWQWPEGFHRESSPWKIAEYLQLRRCGHNTLLGSMSWKLWIPKHTHMYTCKWDTRNNRHTTVYNLASDSSRESKFSHKFEMIPSYWVGYFLKMSWNKHTTRSCEKWVTTTHSRLRVCTVHRACLPWWQL